MGLVFDSVEAAVAHARRLAALQDQNEGAHLQDAADLILRLLPSLPDAAKPAAAKILWRTGLYDQAASLGDLRQLGRWCALNDDAGQLLQLFSRVETEADRLELLHLHRLWGEGLEARAAERPIPRTPSRARGGPLRLGFLSSDLRHHVVAYFAQPLFQHLDPRFELYGYSSFRGAPDVAQQWIATRCAAFRILPPDDRAAAQLIAADDLDLLVELGGPTPGNRPGVLAYRPAPRQASWLGYPHSLGLAAIDHLIADPYLVPPRPEMLLEAPLLMPASWVAMAPAAFQPEPALQPVAPVERTGRITFGTANDPYKFNPRLLRTWARVVAAVPGSRFMIVRPEAGAPSFREAIAHHFAEEGVGVERLDFRPIRGAVRALYGEMDIALDTFPVTGGTTTCEALWMGVPTVSLAGEAMFERMSWSILNNVGLADLAATTIEDYERIAVGLARDPGRIAELRRTARERILAHPLGRPQAFAQAFYDLIARTLAAD
ncbi:MAG: hypothetical protein JWP50_1496 [Phenylobacterium sp.]|nr:hypothetical protein [Phenylobacterium sp.]